MATAIPKACLASSAIRCRDVETGPNLGVLAVYPSNGATCRCPLPSTGCLRRSLLIGQLHPYNRGGHEESHPPVHLSHEPDRWDGVRYLRV